MNPLDFHRSIERFGESIVKAYPRSADRPPYPELAQDGSELAA